MMETIAYKGWETCYRLANGLVEVIVTGDVGPRVIHFGFPGEGNEFYANEALLGHTGGEEWLHYGGHYLRHAPEAYPRTYAPDNTPVEAVEQESGGRFIQPVEQITGVQKEIDITLDPKHAHVIVTHRLRNTTLWAVELAPWALSVMAQGGKAILPLPPRGSHQGNLVPTSIIALWAYTDMRDRRWTWGTKYVMLQQEPGNPKPQKAGVWAPDGWAAYARDEHLFVKTFPALEKRVYPDRGCNLEAYTDAQILEVETLGPLTRVEPGKDVIYVEHWYLFKDVPVPDTDIDVEAYVLPKVKGVLSENAGTPSTTI